MGKSGAKMVPKMVPQRCIFLVSSMRFLAVKWGFKARDRGDDHAYSVISSTELPSSMARRIDLPEVAKNVRASFIHGKTDRFT